MQNYLRKENFGVSPSEYVQQTSLEQYIGVDMRQKKPASNLGDGRLDPESENQIPEDFGIDHASYKPPLCLSRSNSPDVSSGFDGSATVVSTMSTYTDNSESSMAVNLDQAVMDSVSRVAENLVLKCGTSLNMASENVSSEKRTLDIYASSCETSSSINEIASDQASCGVTRANLASERQGSASLVQSPVPIGSNSLALPYFFEGQLIDEKVYIQPDGHSAVLVQLPEGSLSLSKLLTLSPTPLPTTASQYSVISENSLVSPSDDQHLSYNAVLPSGSMSTTKAIPTPQSTGELCRVCEDHASGYHYNCLSCESCKKFFQRSVTKCSKFACIYGKKCEIDMYMRKKCQACRLKKCFAVGMRQECVVPQAQYAVKRKAKALKKKPSTTECYSGESEPVKKRAKEQPLKTEEEELIKRLVYFQVHTITLT